MDPTLIKANIALFNGAPSEARRLLREYNNARGTGPRTEDETPLVLWLEAQTRESRQERMERLQMLAATVGPGNEYADMARAYLAEEARYNADLADEGAPPRRRLLNVPLGSWLLLALLSLASVVAAGMLINTLRGGSATVAPTPAPPPSGSPTALAVIPDSQINLNPTNYTSQYARGILQITAIRTSSQQVIDPGTGEYIDPVAGARFYALAVTFECRAGICSLPPEADVSVRLDDGTVIPPRVGAAIKGSTPLAPIARGRSTEGWLIFEVPIAGQVHALLLSPRTDSGTPEAAQIALPSS